MRDTVVNKSSRLAHLDAYRYRPDTRGTHESALGSNSGKPDGHSDNDRPCHRLQKVSTKFGDASARIPVADLSPATLQRVDWCPSDDASAIRQSMRRNGRNGEQVPQSRFALMACSASSPGNHRYRLQRKSPGMERPTITPQIGDALRDTTAAFQPCWADPGNQFVYVHTYGGLLNGAAAVLCKVVALNARTPICSLSGRSTCSS